jgi:hypothetical protein
MQWPTTPYALDPISQVHKLASKFIFTLKSGDQSASTDQASLLATLVNTRQVLITFDPRDLKV